MANTKQSPGVATYSDFDEHSIPVDDNVIETMSEPKHHPRVALVQNTETDLDVTDPAQVAMLVARFAKVNNGLHRIAQERLNDEQNFAIETDRLQKQILSHITELDEAKKKIEDLTRDLSHARELVDAVKGSAPYQFTKLWKLFAVTLAVSSAATIGFTLFSL